VRICSLALLVGCFGDDGAGPNSQLYAGTIRVRATTTGRDIDGRLPRAGETVTVDVLVTRSAFGMVEVTLSTTGTDLDGNGYQIAVTGGREFQEFRTSVAVNTTGTFLVPRCRRVAT